MSSLRADSHQSVYALLAFFGPLAPPCHANPQCKTVSVLVRGMKLGRQDLGPSLAYSNAAK